MELQARVQGRFPFLGTERRPGDMISTDELAQTTQTVIDALLSQKLITLVGVDGVPVDMVQGLVPMPLGPSNAEIMARLDEIVERLDRVEAGGDTKPNKLIPKTRAPKRK